MTVEGEIRDHFDFPGRIYVCEECDQATNDLIMCDGKWLCPFCRGDCIRHEQ
jgi:hypothetical protein